MLVSVTIRTKNVEICNTQPMQSREAIRDGCEQVSELLIVEKNVKSNILYHKRIVVIIHSFGVKIACPTFMKS